MRTRKKRRDPRKVNKDIPALVCEYRSSRRGRSHFGKQRVGAFRTVNYFFFLPKINKNQSANNKIDRVPDELWKEVRDIVQETGIKTIPMEKKCKKAKWLSGEALQIAVKRREVKSKGEKERYSI